MLYFASVSKLPSFQCFIFLSAKLLPVVASENATSCVQFFWTTSYRLALVMNLKHNVGVDPPLARQETRQCVSCWKVRQGAAPWIPVTWSTRMREVMMRPYWEKSCSSSFWVMVFGRPLTYKLASRMEAELGRAYDTCGETCREMEREIYFLSGQNSRSY